MLTVHPMQMAAVLVLLVLGALIAAIPMALILGRVLGSDRRATEARLACLRSQQKTQGFLLKTCFRFDNSRMGSRPDLFLKLEIDGDMILAYRCRRLGTGAYEESAIWKIKADPERERFGFTAETEDHDDGDSVQMDLELEDLEEFISLKLDTGITSVVSSKRAACEEEISRLEKELQPA